MTLRLAAAAAVGATASIAACAPGPQDSVPITGTLHAIVAPPVALSADADEPIEAGGFVVDAELDGVAVAGTGQWACYPPGGGFPDVDTEAFDDDQRWGVFLSVAPLLWTTGAIAIDGEDVRLVVSGRNSYGLATTGTVQVTEAGDTCAWSVAGPIPLAGEKDPSDK